MRCCPGDARCAAIERSSVTDGGSSKRTMSGTHRFGYAGVCVVRAKRRSRYCPIGRRPRGSTVSIAGNRPGSCCADSTVDGNDRFRTSPTHRGHQIHRRCGAGPDACCTWELCWQRSSGRLPAGVPRHLPPSLPGTGSRFAVFCPSRPEVRESPRPRRVETADSTAGLSTGSGLAPDPAIEPRPLDGLVSTA